MTYLLLQGDPEPLSPGLVGRVTPSVWPLLPLPPPACTGGRYCYKTSLSFPFSVSAVPRASFSEGISVLRSQPLLQSPENRPRPDSHPRLGLADTEPPRCSAASGGLATRPSLVRHLCFSSSFLYHELLEDRDCLLISTL